MQFTIATEYEATYCCHYFFGATFRIGSTYDTDTFVYTQRQFLEWFRPGMDVFAQLPIDETNRLALGIQSQDERRAGRIKPKKRIERNLITPLPLPG